MILFNKPEWRNGIRSGLKSLSIRSRWNLGKYLPVADLEALNSGDIWRWYRMVAHWHQIGTAWRSGLCVGPPLQKHRQLSGVLG